MFKMRRVYLPAEPGDDFRILVDRLWPRGLSKSAAKIDLWMKDIAPSDRLREWFGHDPERWAGFAERYREELGAMRDQVSELRRLGKEHKAVTLLFGAKDEARNNAAVLLKMLGRGSGKAKLRSTGPASRRRAART